VDFAFFMPAALPSGLQHHEKLDVAVYVFEAGASRLPREIYRKYIDFIEIWGYTAA
jgi:hypothetical protein